MKITRGELRSINKKLHLEGEHICTKCFTRLPYTEEFFEVASRVPKLYLSAQCRLCRNVKRSGKAHSKYENDPEYRRTRSEYDKRWREGKEQANAMRVKKWRLTHAG